jgi:stage III sporulation protein AH
MKVLYVNKKSALFGLLLVVFILFSGYSLFADFARAPRSPAPVAQSNDSQAKVQQQGNRQVDLLPVVPDLSSEDFFVECRLARDRMRSQQLETLKEIADQPNSSSEVRDSAQRDLMQLTDNMSKEAELEKMVVAQGYNDAAVMILPRSVTVVIQVQSVPSSGVDKIKALVARTTGLDNGSIFVIPKP